MKRQGPPIINKTVIDDGKTYRIASMGSRVLIVAQKLPTGGERVMNVDGKRAKQLIKKSRQP